MLHEDDFGDIIAVYKELRADGVVFPRREAANQFFINFAGRKSPIFEGIEGERVYEEPAKTLNPCNSYAVRADDPCATGKERAQLPPRALPSVFTVSDAPIIERTLFHFEELLAAVSEASELKDATFIKLLGTLRRFAESAREFLSAPETDKSLLAVVKSLYPRVKKAIRDYEDRLEGFEMRNGDSAVVDLLEMDEPPKHKYESVEEDLLNLDINALSISAASPQIQKPTAKDNLLDCFP